MMFHFVPFSGGGGWLLCWNSNVNRCNSSIKLLFPDIPSVASVIRLSRSPPKAQFGERIEAKGPIGAMQFGVGRRDVHGRRRGQMKRERMLIRIVLDVDVGCG